MSFDDQRGAVSGHRPHYLPTAVIMTFYQWLQKWVEKNKERRDMWGAMAYHIGNVLARCPEKVAGMEASVSILAPVLGFGCSAAERWMFAELAMRHEDGVPPDAEDVVFAGDKWHWNPNTG